MGKWAWLTVLGDGVIMRDGAEVTLDEVLRILNAHEKTLAALRKYGKHSSDCARYIHKCDCGFKVAIAAAEGGSDE